MGAYEHLLLAWKVQQKQQDRQRLYAVVVFVDPVDLASNWPIKADLSNAHELLSWSFGITLTHNYNEDRLQMMPDQLSVFSPES